MLRKVTTVAHHPNGTVYRGKNREIAIIENDGNWLIMFKTASKDNGIAHTDTDSQWVVRRAGIMVVCTLVYLMEEGLRALLITIGEHYKNQMVHEPLVH